MTGGTVSVNCSDGTRFTPRHLAPHAIDYSSSAPPMVRRYLTFLNTELTRDHADQDYGDTVAISGAAMKASDMIAHGLNERLPVASF